MAENEVLQAEPEPRRGWRRWVRLPKRRWSRVTVGLLTFTVTLVGFLLVAVVARPWLLVPVINFALREQPIRVYVGDARLVAPFGWWHPTRWRWRVDDFSIISNKQGTPSLLADLVIVHVPNFRRSLFTRNFVFSRIDARGFIISVGYATPPPPFEEEDAWPLRGLMIEQGVLVDFELVMVDPSGMPIVIDKVDGQMQAFRYDFGHRHMYGVGSGHRGTLGIGPIQATDVEASPIIFDGVTMVAKGFGTVGGQEASILFEIDGLFRAAAALHVEIEISDGDLRALLAGALGDEAPDADGTLWGKAVFDSKPPDSNLDMTIRLENGSITLAEDTKGIILAALELAPFVELDDHTLHLGTLSGRIEFTDDVITLTDGRYVAARSSAQVDGRVSKSSLRGRVRFSPEPGASGGISWGLVLSGTAKHPKIQLADQQVLEAWTVDGPETTQEIRVDVKEARRERRELWIKAREERREARKAGEPDAPEPDGSAPPLEGPVEKLP